MPAVKDITYVNVTGAAENDLVERRIICCDWGCSTVPHLQKLIDHAHDADIPVFFMMTNDETTESKMSKLRHTEGRQKNCIDGTWGAEFYVIQPTE